MTRNPWMYRWDVQSRTTNDKHTVSMRRDGTWGCSCGKWVFAKAPKPDCHHIEKVKLTEPLAKMVMDVHGVRAPVAVKPLEMAVVALQEPYYVMQTVRQIFLED